jgi:hypothetical protein
MPVGDNPEQEPEPVVAATAEPVTDAAAEVASAKLSETPSESAE